uniref:Putative salivary secreted peptide of the 13 kDa family n=1 Tax=Ochlerotatus triseriatus TaxID=7162 RepID=C6ZQU7_OCHTR
MQLVPKGSICSCLIVLFSILINVTSALQCTHCLDPRSCRSNPEAIECAVDNVSLHRRLLGFQNPSLASAGDGSADGYKCFDLKMTYTSPLTGSTVLVEEKGCTYAGTDLCSGWSSTTQVERCSTCDSDDECNK